jgi:hypothetical protein
MGFVISIILLYMVYVKIDIMISQTGESLSNITTSAIATSPNYQDIMNTIENFKKSELSFFTIVMKSIGSFCSENSIQTNFSKLIAEIITKAGSALADKCGTNVEYVSNTGFLSHILPSSMIQYANVGLNTVTTYTAPVDTMSCLANQAKIQLESLVTTNKTYLSQISGLLNVALAVGTPSILYLIKRLNEFRSNSQGLSSSSSSTSTPVTSQYSLTTVNLSKQRQFNPRKKSTWEGGKKSKKYRKNKRKTKKNRRKTRKNRRN